MKKLLIVSLMVVSVGASANTYLDWQADAGFYFTSTPAQGFLSPASSGNSALAQLIYSPDNVIDAVDLSDPNYVGGNDVFLASLTVTEGSGSSEWGDFAPVNYNGAYVAGYIYGRIFQDTTPAAGEVYYNGLTAVVQDLDPMGSPPDTPQQYNLNQNFGDPLDQTIAAIPEPGTLAFMALGMLTVMARRFRK